MKYRYIILSVILLIGAMFGFFFMHSGNAMGHEGCLAAGMQGVECPGEAAGSVKFSLFHLRAFEIISTAVVKSLYAASFLVIIAFLLARLALLYELFIFARVKTCMRAYLMVCTQQCGKHFGYWISLHEHSPAFVMAAMEK